VPSTATPGEAGSPAVTNTWSANDLWLEAFVIFNFLSLTGDIAIAHSENRFRVDAEYLSL
jgi:hypothetical protein